MYNMKHFCENYSVSVAENKTSTPVVTTDKGSLFQKVSFKYPLHPNSLQFFL